MKVAKFGGSSVADAAQIRKVRDIVHSDPLRRIVVVSAPGKRHAKDVKVTDLLIQCAQCVLAGKEADEEVARVVERYRGIAVDLGLPAALAEEFRMDLTARLAGGRTHVGRFEDSVKAAGEDYCARLVAAYFRISGMAAQYVTPKEAGLLVSEEYGQARLLKDSYARLAALKMREGIIVFPGFFGHSRDGHVVTFSRGGSDLTGAILAAAVGADAYENFTDVDGIFAADPRVVQNPHLIQELTYQELRELSYGGFSVFHEEAMLPALEAGIPINVRNTNNPAHPGTWVVISRSSQGGTLTGIACDAGFCGIYVSKYLMNREKGFGRRLLEIIEDEDLSFDHAPSGVDNITIVLKQNQLSDHTVERIKKRVRGELGADTVSIQYGLAVLSLVGGSMAQWVTIAARVTGALARAGINIEMIVQGPSEFTMILGVKSDDAPKAVRAIYAEFFASAPPHAV